MAITTGAITLVIALGIEVEELLAVVLTSEGGRGQVLHLEVATAMTIIIVIVVLIEIKQVGTGLVLHTGLVLQMQMEGSMERAMRP